MSFDDIRENKLLAKISEFTVSEQNRMFILDLSTQPIGISSHIAKLADHI